ncbi:thioredoxin reductase (NADPH) [Rhodoligotrophos appendicifer]
MTSRTVLMATGVENLRPTMSEEDHAQALSRGLVRYCPVCDGFEVTDKHIAVLGTGEGAVNEAMFLRSYTSSVTLVSADRDHEISSDQQERLKRCGIDLIPGPCLSIHLRGREIELTVPSGTAAFDSLYPALGTKIRSSLARDLGVNISADGCIVVDDGQRSSMPGLYAAGDVVYGLDQICCATGQSAMAATSIRNDLCYERQLLRASDAGCIGK